MKKKIVSINNANVVQHLIHLSRGLGGQKITQAGNAEGTRLKREKPKHKSTQLSRA